MSMRVFEHGDALPPEVAGTIVTVGTFDGVHRGHLDVLARLAERAAHACQPGLLVTFEPHPLEVLNPSAAPRLLTTRAEKLLALEAAGLEYLAVVPFTAGLAQQSAQEFVEEVLRGRFRMSELLIGHDHGFGRGREGDVESLRALGQSHGFVVDVVPPVSTEGGDPISSTLVRQALLSGDLEFAASMLGRTYSVRGPVVAGEARGRTLGFPTLNVAMPAERKLLPADGVYAVIVDTEAGRHGGMLNLGGRPTFGDEMRALEAHLFDVEGDFYGQVVEVGFLTRLRETRLFGGADALRAQLVDDERAARSALTGLASTANFKGSMHFPPSTP